MASAPDATTSSTQVGGAARCRSLARRAQRLLQEPEPKRLDEFEANLDMLSDAVADLWTILDQRHGRRGATRVARQPRGLAKAACGPESYKSLPHPRGQLVSSMPASRSVMAAVGLGSCWAGRYNFLRTLKAGPAGGRLRRPSSRRQCHDGHRGTGLTLRARGTGASGGCNTLFDTGGRLRYTSPTRRALGQLPRPGAQVRLIRAERKG